MNVNSVFQKHTQTVFVILTLSRTAAAFVNDPNGSSGNMVGEGAESEYYK